MKLYYTETEPPENLKSFFSEISKFEVKEKKKLKFQLLFAPAASLLIVYSGKTQQYISKIAGYRNQKLKINLPENSVLYMFKFRPEVFYLINKGEIEKFKNKITSFPALNIKEEIESDKELFHIVSSYFNKQTIDSGKVKGYITDTIDLIYKQNGVLKLNEIIRAVNVSTRQFQRDFKKVTGFSLKEFSSIVRINSLSSELIKDNVSLKDIFFNFGFYDQAHFNKEFKKLVGANPSLFESRQKLIKYLNLLK